MICQEYQQMSHSMFNENKRLILLAVSYATGWSLLKAESDYLHRSGAVSLQSSFIASSPS